MAKNNRLEDLKNYGIIAAVFGVNAAVAVYAIGFIIGILFVIYCMATDGI